MIKVLVVEDSLVAAELLAHILDSDPQLQVMATVSNGKQALDFLSREKPDVITMDIHMPDMDGLEVTRRIMETQPVPIVVVSASWNPDEVATTFRAMEAGAVALLEKPPGIGHPDYPAMAKKIVNTVKAMSEVKVVRRWPRSRYGEAVSRLEAPDPASKVKAPPVTALKSAEIKVVAIGTSTGGPQVLQTILTGLPTDFQVPVLIVQHIAAGFLKGLVDWLSLTSGFPIHIAVHGEQLLPGRAYLAADGFHMGVDKNSRILLSQSEPENGLRPAVSYMFRSVAEVYGANAVGVLLTGMGKDGADELGLIKRKGAVTIAQDQESSVVHGMPGEAIKLGHATHILPPDRIVAMLVTLVQKKA